VPRAVIGSAHILSGEPELGITPLLTALRLNPHNLYLFHLLGELAVAHYMLGRWEEAIGWCNSSLSLRPGYWYPRLIMIGALARSGQLQRAQAALSEFATRCPSFRPEHIRWLPFGDHTWHDYLLDGLKMAGYAV
jgi:adenylate cyclase